MVWWKRGVQMVMHSIIRVLGRHIELPLTCTKWLDIFAANSYGVTQLMHDASSLLYRLNVSTYVCIFMGQAHDSYPLHNCAKDRVAYKAPPV